MFADPQRSKVLPLVAGHHSFKAISWMFGGQHFFQRPTLPNKDEANTFFKGQHFPTKTRPTLFFKGQHFPNKDEANTLFERGPNEVAELQAVLGYGSISAPPTGMSIARVWACRYSKGPPWRGGHFEYQHAHTRTMDMPPGRCQDGANIERGPRQSRGTAGCSRLRLAAQKNVSGLETERP